VDAADAVDDEAEAVAEAEAEADADAVEPTPDALEVAPEPAPKTPFVEPLPELPDAFGTDRIVVMARDPESAFIYWELTPDGVGRARAALGASLGARRLVLRLYRRRGRRVDRRGPPVRDWLGRHTWHADRAGQRLAASIGYLADGVFVHVTQSPRPACPAAPPGTRPCASCAWARRLTPRSPAAAPDASPECASLRLRGRDLPVAAARLPARARSDPGGAPPRAATTWWPNPSLRR
jgi:hypothetical protein